MKRVLAALSLLIPVILPATARGADAGDPSLLLFDELFLQSNPPEAQSESGIEYSVPIFPADGVTWGLSQTSSKSEVKNGVLFVATDGEDELSGTNNLVTVGTPGDFLRIQASISGSDQFILSWESTEGPRPIHALKTIPRQPMDPKTGEVTLSCESEQVDPWDINAVEVPVPEADRLITYNVPVGQCENWQYNNIRQIRLHFAGPMKAEIHSIVLQSPKGKAGLGTFLLDGQYRPCLYMRPSTSLDLSVTIPPNGCFTAGLGTFASTSPVSCRLQIRTPEAARTVLSQPIEDSKWYEASVDLSEFAGQSVICSLSVSSKDQRGLILWSNPLIYRRLPLIERRPNIIVYVIDALRTDHLEAYGYKRPTTPAITAFAATSTRFDRCYADATWTLPSIASLFTGVSTFVHSLGDSINIIPDKLDLVPNILRRQGYATLGISNNFLAPPVTRRPFVFNYLCRDKSAPDSLHDLIPVLGDRSFFLYIHTLECHGVGSQTHPSYDPPQRFRTSWAQGDNPKLEDLYDACVASADDNFKQVMDLLQEHGMLDNTVIILMADHGEAFGEHGTYGHCNVPYIELTHIPLFIHWPDRFPTPGAIEANVHELDISSTILDMAGIPSPPQFQGASLLPLLEGKTVPPFSEDRLLVQYHDAHIGAIKGDTAVLLSPIPVAAEELFDLKSDPGETINLLKQRPDQGKAIAAEVANYLVEQGNHKQLFDVPQKQNAVINFEVQQALRALGYWGETPTPAP